MSQLPAPSLISELENRQEEAMKALAELEQRIELALSEFGGTQSSWSKKSEGASVDCADKPQHSQSEPEKSAQPSAA